ncbi:MAG: electron transfer flavoprotein-ubiquinone oxidoreductase [Acidobacteria bacterium]|nr:electron transfer flavoprotein-ubiquinone oxidoreductase [Acidobacteriota bacterium]
MRERETLEFDVLFVGAGPAGLAGAYHLSQLVRSHNRALEGGPAAGAGRLGEISIAVIEKGREVNSHAFSGAILDLRALRELIPDFAGRGAPVETRVTGDHICYLTRTGKFSSPFIPPPLNNHGHSVISLGKLVGWLAAECEQNGINIFAETSGVELLFDGDRVMGVRCGDKGVDKQGNPKANHEPGVDLIAKVTILGEGPRGTLTKRLIGGYPLDRTCNPQVYSIGVKETWQLPDDRIQAGTVTHTLGYPLGRTIFGGGFLYMRSHRVLDAGLVVGPEHGDPTTDPHRLFNDWKRHPMIVGLLKGASLIGYGAKAIPEGGLFSQPKLVHDGVMIIGDSAGFLNSQRLKGIHLAMKSGMLAAEAAFEALLARDFSSVQLERYPEKYRESWAYRELYRVRNFHQGFQAGLLTGILHGGLQMITGGRGLWSRYPTKASHEYMKKLPDISRAAPEPSSAPSPLFPSPLPSSAKQFDNTLVLDKVTDVYHSGTGHEEDQPCHLHVLDINVCKDRCTREFGNPCQYFCPAAVYEIVDADRGRMPFINFSNCVHCKTCDIMDPYQIIDWVPPQGGDGPGYKNM